MKLFSFSLASFGLVFINADIFLADSGGKASVFGERGSAGPVGRAHGAKRSSIIKRPTIIALDDNLNPSFSSVARFLEDAEKNNVDEEEECLYFPEILLIQDVSDSFKDDIPNVVKLLPDMFALLNDKFGDYVRFGVVSFTDKHIKDCKFAGNSEDFCASLEVPLGKVNAEHQEKVISTLNSLLVSGGGDFLDGANEAIVRALVSDSVGWSKDAIDPESGRPIIQVVILATDAGFHEAEYALNECMDDSKLGVKQEVYPNDLLKNPAQIAKDINANCNKMDFPSNKDVREALKYRSFVIPIIFAGAPSYVAPDGTAWNYGQYATQVIEHYGYDEYEHPWGDHTYGLANFYGDYFSQILRYDAVVQFLNNDSANLLDIFAKALNEVEYLKCIRSTTEAPVTSVTTAEPETSATATGSTAHSSTSKQTEPTDSKRTERSETSQSEQTEPSEPTDSKRTERSETSQSEQTEAVLPGTEEEEKQSHPAVIIGAASGGVAAAAAGALVAVRKFGVFGSSTPSASDMGITQDADNADAPQDREQFEAVTGDLFA